MSSFRAIGSIAKRAALDIARLLAEGAASPELQALRKAGFSPQRVLDIGAYVGDWAVMARRVFPQARIHMIEAQPEMASRLRKVSDTNPDVTFDIALLGAERRAAVPFFQMQLQSTTGCSIYPEQTPHPRSIRHLPMQTLDDLIDGRDPFELIKLDVQGAELEVLSGGRKAVSKAEAIVMEVSFVEFNKGGPVIADTIAQMHELGFDLFEIFAELRDRRGRLLQGNAIFVRRGSHLWPSPPF